MSPSCARPAAPEPRKVSCVPTYHGHLWAVQRTVQMLFTDTSCENAVPSTPRGCLFLSCFELGSPFRHNKKEQCMVPAQAVT